MGHLGKGRDIGHAEAGIGDGLDPDPDRVGSHRSRHRLRCGFDRIDAAAPGLEQFADHAEGPPEDLLGHHDLRTRPSEGEQQRGGSRLTRTERDRPNPPLEGGQSLLERSRRGVMHPPVLVAVRRSVEDSLGMISSVKDEAARRHDRDRPRPRGGVGTLLAGME